LGATQRGGIPHRFRRRSAGGQGAGAYAVQSPFQRQLLEGKTTHAAWRSKPTFYAVSTEDRTINPDLERFMAKLMNAITIEVTASHLSLISQPDAIAGLILDAAGRT
jgi:pimeloyl-ACP methyl ester carboxylesterase